MALSERTLTLKGYKLRATSPELCKASSNIAQQLSSLAALDLLVGELGKLPITVSGSETKGA